MPTTSRTAILVAILVVGKLAWSQDFKTRLAEAESTHQIVEFYERFGQFGDLKAATFESPGPPIFVLWTQATATGGVLRGSFAWAYFLQGDRWHLFLDEFFTESVDRAVTSPSAKTLRLFGQHERLLKEQSLESLQPLPSGR